MKRPIAVLLLTLSALMLYSCLQAEKEQKLFEFEYNPPSLVWRTASSTGMDSAAIRSIAYNNARYIAVGEGKIAVSDNGRNWTENTAEKAKWNNGGDYVYFRSVVWGSGRFVAVGYWVNRPDNAGAIFVSDANGENWNLYSAPPLSVTLPGGQGTLSVDPKVYGVSYGSGRYVAVGERGWSAWSTNGSDWTPVWIAPFSDINSQETNQDALAIASDGIKFVVGGTEGKLAWSADGASWDWIANDLLGEYNDIFTIGYGGGKFIAAGFQGMMKTAGGGQIETDGASQWITAESRFTTDINAVVWGNGCYLAVGNGGRMALSIDGSLWTVVSNSGWEVNDNIYCAVYGSRFAAGGDAKIIYSE